MKRTLFSAAAVALLATSSTVQAITINGSVGGAPTGVNYLNFDDLTPGATGSLSATGPDGPVTVNTYGNAQVASGALGGVYAAPYISGSNGFGFDSQTSAGPDTTPYLTTGRTQDGGAVLIEFPNDQRYLGLLWGSVDDYNALQFFDSAFSLVATVTGVDVIGSPNGDQGVNGTVYVNIDNVTPFRYVAFTSGQFAFEFDNVAYNSSPMTTPEAMPEGGSMNAVFGLTLAGLAALTRKLRK